MPSAQQKSILRIGLPNLSFVNTGAIVMVLGQDSSRYLMSSTMTFGIFSQETNPTPQIVFGNLFKVYLNCVTIPKLPPPPRNAHNKSSCSGSSARTNRPSANNTSAPHNWSQVSPYFPINHPIPPPKVNPAIPVSLTVPVGTT